MIPIHGGHDRGQLIEAMLPHINGRPRAKMTDRLHYEWDVYELKRREDGSMFYLWTETRACCYQARIKGMQPVAP